MYSPRKRSPMHMKKYSPNGGSCVKGCPLCASDASSYSPVRRSPKRRSRSPARRASPRKLSVRRSPMRRSPMRRSSPRRSRSPARRR